MGIIRAVTGAVGGVLADSWLESIEADDMGAGTIMTTGVNMRRDKRGQNVKGTKDLISDGSIIHVGVNQCMLLVDGGKIVDFSAEPGYYKVDNKGMPSLFNGQLEESLLDTFQRIKFGGTPSQSQKVYYINTQEIRDISFGTRNPINYFDGFYNAELYLRCHGYFSVRVVDPLKFYAEVVPRSAERMESSEMQKLFLAEFLTALQTSINKMSVDGIRISHVASKTMELAKYLSSVLDEEWTGRRGMIIESVGVSSISYDDESKKLINMRNQGAMLSDASIREGYVQGAVARGMEAAGSNSGGAISGFMGMGIGTQAGGGFMGAASASNQAQMDRQATQQQQPPQQLQQQQTPAPNGWTCSCGASNSGNFCQNCGNKRPSFCQNCGAPAESGGNFCQNCGHKL